MAIIAHDPMLILMIITPTLVQATVMAMGIMIHIILGEAIHLTGTHLHTMITIGIMKTHGLTTIPAAPPTTGGK